MILARRQAILGGAAFLAAPLVLRDIGRAAETIEIGMAGRPDGSRVWFDPVGIHVAIGATIRWTNRDRGNSHTVTAYHPANGRPLRIPEAAEPWDSGYLLPNETFSITLLEEGVYDYYCIPHEHAGMVGRIVVGTPPAAEPDWGTNDPALAPLPDIAVESFPDVVEIVANARINPA